MAGRQAKVLSDGAILHLLQFVRRGRYGNRNVAMVLLSFKAGLRAGEIANLTWPMVLTSEGEVSDLIEICDWACKKRSGRTIPMHRDIHEALIKLKGRRPASGPVIRSERGGQMRPSSVVNWFRGVYAALGYSQCSSHSGRTFVTSAAKMIFRAGGSLGDVQQLAGHRSIEQTQRYIDGDAAAKRKLMDLL